MNGVGIFFVVLLVVLVSAAIGWVVFTQLRARRLGLPAPSLSSYNPFARSEPSPYGPPTPAPGGIRGWINDKLRSAKGGGSGNATTRGAYEQPTDYTSGRRGFGPLDPDDAWDARVHHDDNPYGGYYEEQELGGLRPHDGGAAANPYGGDSSYPMNLAATTSNLPQEDEQERRGRSRSREPAAAEREGAANPFDDNAEPSNISLRGVSPRPIDTGAAAGKSGAGAGPASGDSPSERRSIFRENV